MALVAHAISTEYALRLFQLGENWSLDWNSSNPVMSTASLTPSVIVQSTTPGTGSGPASKADVKSSPSMTSLPGARRPSTGSGGRVPPPPPVRHPSTVVTSTGTTGRRSSHSAVGSGSGSSSSGGGRAWANAYELSQDIRDRQMEALARRYGGASKAGKAAAVIQHAYRRHCMTRNFAKLRLEADERWRFNRQNGCDAGSRRDFTRSRSMWTEHSGSAVGMGFGFDALARRLDGHVTATDKDGYDNDDDFEAALAVVASCVGAADFDVMSHSFSADNMLTLTRKNRSSTGNENSDRSPARSNQTFESNSSTDAGDSVKANSSNKKSSNSSKVVRIAEPSVTSTKTAAGPCFSSGDSSDEGGSARNSPVPGVDPASADFETALEANVATDDDSFDSSEGEDDDAEVPATSTPTGVSGNCRSPAHQPVDPAASRTTTEQNIANTEVRLRRKKVDVTNIDDGTEISWQWKHSMSSASSSSDGDRSSHRTSDVQENCEFYGATDYLTLLAAACRNDSVTSSSSLVSRTSCERGHREASPQPTSGPHLTMTSRLSERLRKRTYRIGLNLFNKKPEQGICYLVEHQFLDDRPSSVARFLITRKGLSKQMIGEYLGNLQRPFNMEVLTCFTEQIDLTGLQIDVALRKYQSYFRMPGEAQKIERLMEAFASRYCRCNSDEVNHFESVDTVFLLAFAIIMLNTDLHNASIKPERKMKLNDFIRNLRGIDGGCDINVELLRGIYERVRDCEFKPGTDHVSQVMRIEQMIVGRKLQLAVPCRRLVCYCRLCEVRDIVKREKPGRHQREIFLFNDLLVITKIISRKKTAEYSLRQSFPLVGMTVYLFNTPHYQYGIRLATSIDDKTLIMLNARNETDCNKFVDDLKEAILEMNEMETMRIDDELKKQKVPPNPVNVNRYSKDSGVVDIELLKLDACGGGHRLSAPDCERLKKNTLSNSLIDISEGSRRASGGSLDSGMASAESGSTHSCCQHDIAAAAAAGGKTQTPHCLRTLQPPPLTSGGAVIASTPLSAPVISANCRRTLEAKHSMPPSST